MGLGGTEGILAFSYYMQQALLRGHRSRVSPKSCASRRGEKKKREGGKKKETLSW